MGWMCVSRCLFNSNICATSAALADSSIEYHFRCFQSPTVTGSRTFYVEFSVVCQYRVANFRLLLSWTQGMTRDFRPTYRPILIRKIGCLCTNGTSMPKSRTANCHLVQFLPYAVNILHKY